MIIEYSQKEMNYISTKDSKLGFYIKKCGFLKTEIFEDIFESLVSNIIGQMLSNKVARVIYDRFLALVGEIKPETIIKKTDEELRSVGMSYKKAEYIKSLSLMVINKEIDLCTLNRLDDYDLIKYLTKIKGIGKWTAEMIAIFSLGRINIFSYDDAALRSGILKVHKEFKTLSKKRFEELRKLYSPYCTVASLYYYYVNDYE